MDKMPFYLVFLQSFPESLLVICMGLVLLDVRAPSKRILLTALLSALIGYSVRDLSLLPGINVLVQIPFTIIMLILICKISLPIAFSSTILGFLSVIFTEAIFNTGITALTGISSFQAINDPSLRLLYPLPEFIFLAILCLALKRKRINIFTLFQSRVSHILVAKFDIKTVGVMALPLFLVAIGFYYQYYLERQLSAGMWQPKIGFLFSIIMLAVALSLILAWKMILMSGQEAIMEMQQSHISNLQDMVQIIKAQRHDFINQIQAIYGLARLGQIDQLNAYISDIYQDIQVSGDILKLAIPQLSALLLVHSGWATAHNISLQFKIESDLAGLGVPALDLVAVAGNLLKNALEAVDSMEPVNRKVEVKIFETPNYYVIQTQNPGWIPPEIKNNIFNLGFSTKPSQTERGIGLASVKYLVENYQGKVILNTHQDRGTRFTVCYPKH